MEVLIYRSSMLGKSQYKWWVRAGVLCYKWEIMHDKTGKNSGLVYISWKASISFPFIHLIPRLLLLFVCFHCIIFSTFFQFFAFCLTVDAYFSSWWIGTNLLFYSVLPSSPFIIASTPLFWIQVLSSPAYNFIGEWSKRTPSFLTNRKAG